MKKFEINELKLYFACSLFFILSILSIPVNSCPQRFFVPCLVDDAPGFVG